MSAVDWNHLFILAGVLTPEQQEDKRINDEQNFVSKLNRDLNDADRRMASINDKLGQALEFHQGNFSKQMDGLESSHQALSVRSYEKLELETRALLNTFNYAKHFESSATEKFENMQNILNQILFITQSEPESHKKRINEIDTKMLLVQDKMNIEIFEQEVVNHMHRRTREQSDLVKEKVKELIKVMNELDKRHNQARLIENHARNSKEEVEKEKEELKNGLQKQRDNQEKTRSKMENKQGDLESAIRKKKETKDQRIKSEAVIKERAERLKKSISKLKERERKFNMIKQKQKDDQIRFEQQFEKIKARFKTEKPDLINQRFIKRTLKKQSFTNYFNDLTEHLYELWIYKEDLVKQKNQFIFDNNIKLKEKEQIMEQKAEFQESILENKILLQKQRSQKLKDLVTQKQDVVYSAVIGLRHIFDKIKAQQEIVASAEPYKKEIVVAQINYPTTISLCSQLSLVMEKKFGFLLQFKEQDLKYRMGELKTKTTVGGFQMKQELQIIYYQGLPFGELVQLKEEFEVAEKSRGKHGHLDEFQGSPDGSQSNLFMYGGSQEQESDEHDSMLDESEEKSEESQTMTQAMSKQQTIHGVKIEDKSNLGGDKVKRSLSHLQNYIETMEGMTHPDVHNNMPFYTDLEGAEDFITDWMQPAHDNINNQEPATNDSYEENEHIQMEAQIQKKQLPSGQKQPRESTLLSSMMSNDSEKASRVMTQAERVKTFEAAAKSGFVNKGINDANFVEMIYETNKKFKEVDSQIDKLKAHGLAGQSQAVQRRVRGSKSSSDLAQLLDPSKSSVFSRQSQNASKIAPWQQNQMKSVMTPHQQSRIGVRPLSNQGGSIFKSPQARHYQSQQNLFMPKRAMRNGATLDSSKLRLLIKDMLLKVDTNKLGNHVSRERIKTIQNILES